MAVGQRVEEVGHCAQLCCAVVDAVHRISEGLATGTLLPPPRTRDVQRWLTDHLHEHYALYGEHIGVRSARKHIGWAVRALPGGEAFRAEMNLLESCETQVNAVTDWFDALADTHVSLPHIQAANEPFIDTITEARA